MDAQSYRYKVLVLGESATGKTALVNRYLKARQNKDENSASLATLPWDEKTDIHLEVVSRVKPIIS
jgi:GTPase SAR1 family protein